MPRKTVYEDNPWPDVKDVDLNDFIVVENFPSSSELRQAKVRITGESGMFVPFAPRDMQALQRRARKQGVPSHSLAAAILQAFVAGDKGKRKLP